ncbi:MAG: nitrate/nitrite transporter [Caldibacillus thermoamylovorans]
MRKPSIQLTLQTASLITGFMMWVLISSLIPSIKQDIPLTESQVSIITAIPVILGSLLRIPIGFYTDRFGARKLFMLSFTVLLFPVFYVSVANSFIDLVISGLFLGIGGAVFSVGVTSLPKYYPKEKQGFINGVYGVGNAGTAITAFGAPIIAQSLGWQKTAQLYLILLLIFIVFNFIFGDRKEVKVKQSMAEQLKSVCKNTTLWFLSLFYFITFGAFVAFTMFLPNFLVNNFNLDSVDAGIRTAGFIALATLMRPIGGLLADKFNSFIILMFTFIAVTLSAVILAFSPNIELFTVGCLAVALFVGIGNGTVFKLVPLYFSKQAGVVNGIVSAMGGLGGFFPPLVLTAVHNITGQYSIAFMALSEVALACLVIVVWLYEQERTENHRKFIGKTKEL